MYDLFLNKTKEKEDFIGTVVSLNPLMVELIPGDNPIPAIETSTLFGIGVSSRILLKKIGNIFIATNVIAQTKKNQLLVMPANIVIGNTTDYSDLFEINLVPGIYIIEANIRANNQNTTPNARMVWAVSGSYTTISFRLCRGGLGLVNTSDSGNVIRSSVHGITTAVTYAVGTSSSYLSEFFIIQANEDITLKLQGAKNVIHNSNTTFYSGSSVKVQEI
jgi:hypothetical protein